MILSNLKPAVEKLCANVDPVPAWSLENDDSQWSDDYYCEECAGEVVAWLKTGRPASGKPSGGHPDWPSTVDLWAVNHGCEETEGCLICHACGVILQYSLVDVEQELSHFESVVSGETKRVRDPDGVVGPMDEREWAHILAIIEGIEHAERPKWQYADRRATIVRTQHDYYDRTLAMVETALRQSHASISPQSMVRES